jgi:hypothetical protein
MITIVTSLSDGIYASEGGGQNTVHYEWNTGPRNLLRAARTLQSHAREMTAGFGNAGHRASWLEVDGFIIDVLSASSITNLREARLTLDEAKRETSA